MATVKIILDVRTTAQIAADTQVLDVDEPVWRDDGCVAFGDGVTQVNALVFKPIFAVASYVISGGVISVGTYGGAGVNNDIRVTASNYFISGNGSYSAIQTDFLDIALSSAGNQRYIGLYGTTSSTIIKVEGAEASLATPPATPANSVLVGYVLVNSASVSTTPDLSGYLLRADKASTGQVRSGTDDTTYVTPYSLRTGGILPRSSSVASSATPSINADLVDCFSITALAAAITSFTTNLTGAPVNFQPLIIRIKDNGAARAIAWGASFVAMGEALPTTTVISKILTVAFLYDTVLAKWGCVGVKQEA